MKALVLGDTHIGGLDSLFGYDGLTYAMWSWNYAVDYCLENGIQNLIQVGDVFDTPYPSQQALSSLLSVLSKAVKNNLHVYIILGNHDYDVESNGLQVVEWFSGISDNLHVYCKPTMEKIEGEKCWFSPYPHKQEPKEKATCFGHFDIPGFKRDNGMALKGPPVSLKMNWVLGHLHTFQSNRNVVYVGTPYQTNYGEKNKKYMVEIEVIRGKLEWNAVPLKPPFKLKTVNVETQSQLNFPIKENVWYRVRVSSTVTVPENYLSERPQILKLEGAVVGDLETVETDQASGISVSPTFKLKHFLSGKGYSKSEIKKAIKLVKREIS